LQEEYFKMETPVSEENNKRRGEIILEMSEIQRVIKEIKNSYSDIFENTAEAKTKNDTVEWWVLNISLVEDEDKEYKLFYGDGDFDSKTDALEKLEAKDDEFTNEVIKKLSYFISFWYSSSADIKKEDFESAEEHYNKNVSNYLKVEEAKSAEATVPVVETTTTPVVVPVVDAPKEEVKPVEVAPTNPV